jgi:hypothetical protein
VVLVAGGRLGGVLARAGLQARRDECPQADRHQGDHHQAADELGHRELPADEDPEHQAELPDQVRRGELECERRRGRGALLKERLGDRHGRVGARGGRRTQPRREGDRPGAAVRQGVLDAPARHPRLHDGGDEEAEHERPPDLVRHHEGVAEAAGDRLEDVGHEASLYPGRVFVRVPSRPSRALRVPARRDGAPRPEESLQAP